MQFISFDIIYSKLKFTKAINYSLEYLLYILDIKLDFDFALCSRVTSPLLAHPSRKYEDAPVRIEYGAPHAGKIDR